MNGKKIVILGTAYPYRGGLAAFNERLARQFIRDGHDVHIVTFTVQYPSFLFPGKTQYSSLPAPEGLNIERLVNSCDPFNWIRVGRLIGKMSPDFLIIKFWLPFMAPCLGTIARIAKKMCAVRVVSILDNIIPHEKRLGDRIFAKYFINSVDSCVAMSKSVMDDMKRLAPKKKTILSHHPLYDHFGEMVDRNAALLHLGLDQEGHYAMFFGFIREYKGLDLLLKSMADERLVRTDMRLVIAGEYYGDGSQYTDLAERLGISDRIVWRTDFIPDDEVRYYFSAADVIVQPYKSATQSGVTQIAYHFEKPMIVTDVGGLAEIVPDGIAGYVVKPEAGSIADALVDFYSNGKQNYFADGIKSQKSKYSWSAMSEAVLG